MSQQVLLIAVLALAASMPGCASPFHTACIDGSVPQSEEKIDNDDIVDDIGKKATKTGECLKLCFVTAPILFIGAFVSVISGNGIVGP